VVLLYLVINKFKCIEIYKPVLAIHKKSVICPFIIKQNVILYYLDCFILIIKKYNVYTKKNTKKRGMNYGKNNCKL